VILYQKTFGLALSLVILLQGDGVKLDEAFGRRLDGGQDRDPILGVEVGVSHLLHGLLTRL
jgi:hypothetical protein